jgi:hypothetical protein
MGTGIHTSRLVAVVAVNSEEPETDIRKGPLLPLIDPHVFQWAGGDVVPFLARDTTGPAASAPALIEEKSILSHFYSPFKISFCTH